MSETKHIVTLSDHNYLLNGMALANSIRDTSQDYVIHYLCLDEETYMNLHLLKETDPKHKFKPVQLYQIGELMKNEDFQTLADNNESRPIDESDGQSHFHWALASYFSAHLMNKYHLPHVLYVDSDIVFYQDVQRVFDAVGDKSIGLITHKHNKLDKTTTNVGYYNVGVIYFKTVSYTHLRAHET